ncbi:MAG TPA: hypothetical protein DEF39_13945 [Hungateiclostridium thermocellum]|jgi:hypothetical protein|uniref:Uncharacterized protein n=2 Tax=Acetivibrio thermocellus TaxID=1515 RepID=A3DKE7_ACET2|nr:hypothetical protein [Acetivibrio thermocellus]CDG37707.1 hypothetical protein CTHBC1_3150 [Acetivibrio thermocellus BC1]ABN54426.1 hypothetical protein Cthe_3231 [Acetivibrio thermocellus ATCC 27405]ADU73855.1 hypothetical protein Clo1313_0782 [Acetivibrio thermocellus DSM 1313]ALX07792.1 hypothetical protein AD2_00794 [Acetivibrio thermocellus AD2]ANV75534.1 hypothetical protein LQRI_0793 [Acetivibrio thermocellus DSM 2360]
MNRNIKIFMLILFSVIILAGAAIFAVGSLSKDNKQQEVIRTDKEPIINRFPNIGDFEKCYWKSGVMGVGSRWVPGPSDYWMNGFIEIDAGKAEYLIEKYNMKPLNEDLQLAFIPENYNSTISKWFYSEEFNDFIKPPGVLGNFYVDGVNNMIYFEVVIS